MQIAKKIHQIWIPNWSNIPEKYKPRVQSVIDKNPGWIHYAWDDSNIPQLLNSIGPEYLEKYNSFSLIHQKVDFARAGILYVIGGASVDCDAIAYKSFDTLPHIETSDFICSYNSSNSLENKIKAGIPVVLMNATILVKPRHPIVKNLLDYMMGQSCSINESAYSCIQHTTGPYAFTTYLLNNFKNQITILDNSYLDPCNSSDAYCEIKSNTVLDQQQEGSWANPAYKTLQKSYYWIKEHKGIVIGTIVTFILLIVYSTKTKTI